MGGLAYRAAQYCRCRGRLFSSDNGTIADPLTHWLGDRDYLHASRTRPNLSNPTCLNEGFCNGYSCKVRRAVEVIIFKRKAATIDTADLILWHNGHPKPESHTAPSFTGLATLGIYLAPVSTSATCGRASRRKAPSTIIIDPSGYDAGKKTKGRKRHILVDTQGLLMAAIVHPANLHNRDGGLLLMSGLFWLYPFLTELFADGGHSGKTFRVGMHKAYRPIRIGIVKRSKKAEGFQVLPKRWVVERTIAWLNRCHRLAKDWECLSRRALAFLHLASIRFMLRKLSTR
jgi:transposase